MACRKHCADLTPKIRKEIEKIKRQNAKEEKTNG